MARNKVKFAVHLVIIVHDKFLFQRRKGAGYFDGYLGLPSGHVEGGESGKQAMVREAREELGIFIEECDLVHLGTMSHVKPQGMDDYVHLFFDVLDWRGSIKNNEPDRCSELVWAQGLPDDVIPYIHQFLSNPGYSEFRGL